MDVPDRNSPQLSLQKQVLSPSFFHAENSKSSRSSGSNAISPSSYVPQGVYPSTLNAAQQQVHINTAVGRYNPASFEIEPFERGNAYEELTGAGVPEPRKLFETYFPFCDASSNKSSSSSGVIRIMNTPYDVTKNEIVALLGRDARITTYPASGSFYGIHIMFDRSTGKTGEVFVELQNEEEADNVFKSLERYTRRTGKPRMCGNRVTQIQMISQEELMGILFPKAKCCDWVGQSANIREPGPHESRFDGFMNTEELRQILNHAMKPGKGQFGKNAPQRPYEAMISILQKYPWHQAEAVLLAERDNIYNTVRDMVALLTSQVRREKRHTSSQYGLKLNQQLLNELVIVACSETLFNPAQQRHLIDITSQHGPETQVNFSLPRLSGWWPFEVLSVRPKVNERLIEYYAMLMRQATTQIEVISAIQLERLQKQIPVALSALPFGAFTMDYSGNKYLYDCKDIARLEERMLQHLLRNLMDHVVDDGLWIPDCHNTPEPYAGPDQMLTATWEE